MFCGVGRTIAHALQSLRKMNKKKKFEDKGNYASTPTIRHLTRCKADSCSLQNWVQSWSPTPKQHIIKQRKKHAQEGSSSSSSSACAGQTRIAGLVESALPSAVPKTQRVCGRIRAWRTRHDEEANAGNGDQNTNQPLYGCFFLSWVSHCLNSLQIVRRQIAPN